MKGTRRTALTKRLAAVVLSVLCVLGVVSLGSIKVLAIPPIDTEALCHLDVVFAPEGVKAHDVEFRVYKVAGVDSSGHYETEGNFAQQWIQDLLTEPSSENYSILASTLPGNMAGEDYTPTKTSVTDAEGVASFDDLETGLYLVMGDVFHGEEVFYTPHTFLVCLPDRPDGENWSYEIRAEVKWEKRSDSEALDIQVVKGWSDSSTNLHTNDPVTIELYKNDTLYDTCVLDASNNWSYQWEELYGGATWTVKEQGIEENEDYDAQIERTLSGFTVLNVYNKAPYNPPELPDTGLLWWPVPVLLAAGLGIFLIGYAIRRKGRV